MIQDIEHPRRVSNDLNCTMRALVESDLVKAHDLVEHARAEQYFRLLLETDSRRLAAPVALECARTVCESYTASTIRNHSDR